MIDWTKISKEDELLIRDICRRVRDEGIPGLDMLNVSMDISAAHLECPLNLQGLKDSDLGDLLHDVCGIVKHIDRRTGAMRDFFVPRYTARG